MYDAFAINILPAPLMIGCSYEWEQDVNDYGIVEYSSTASGDFERTGTPTPISPAFYNLLRSVRHAAPTDLDG